MRIPQVTGRVRRGPGQALRAVFTGIGQMFLAADRLKEQVESSADSGLRDETARGGSHEGGRAGGSVGAGAWRGCRWRGCRWSGGAWAGWWLREREQGGWGYGGWRRRGRRSVSRS